MAIATSTTKPSGLKITINGAKIELTWKKGETYGEGQQLQYKIFTAAGLDVAASGRNFLRQGFNISGTKWTSKSVTKTATKAELAYNPASYYPTAKTKILYGIQFRIRGKASPYTKGSGSKAKHYTPEWSGWALKTYIINPPAAPTLTLTWDENSVNDCMAEWAGAGTPQRPAFNILLQTVKIPDAPADIRGAVEWDTAADQTKALTGTDTISETGHAGVSFKRAVRAKVRGAGGDSSWVYADHVYAAPHKPEITEAACDYDGVNYIANVQASWTVPEDPQHPVDKNHLWYRIGKPAAGMGLTPDNSWVDAEPSSNNKEYSTALSIPEQIDDDECMWIRVMSKHDADEQYSEFERVYTGTLAAPGTPSITAQDATTHRVTISCTNNSQVPDAQLAVVFQPSTNPAESIIVAIIPHGTSSLSGIQCPDWTGLGTLGFRVYAFVGAYDYWTDADGVKHYTITADMTSEEKATSNTIPLAPAAVAVERSQDEDNALTVTWEHSWTDATGAEVSWSNHRNAWHATAGPDTHDVPNTNESRLDISGLAAGETYFIRVRLYKDDGDDRTYGPYTPTYVYTIGQPPAAPALTLSEYHAGAEDTVTASWSYVSQDGTPQIYAELAEAITAGGQTTYNRIAEVAGDRAAVIDIKKMGWAVGTQHDIAVRVVSGSNLSSEWSGAVTLTITTPVVATITQASLVSNGRWELQEMPLTVTVTGAGTAGTTDLRIIRAADFTEDRPDESQLNGFAGEVILQRTYTGETQQTIETEDLKSYLDDTAEYRLIATVTDQYGQTDSDVIDFTVAWTAQAVMPEGSVAIIDDAAYITVGTPAGATGTVDIYRLSIDKPEIIYEGAAFGDVIVDPFPAAAGGYRLCLKTENGDYTTADGELAWVDIDTNYLPLYQFIDFSGYHLGLLFDVTINASWAKDFQTTKYLGGSQRGDWLAGVTRTGSVASVKLTEDDVDDRHILRMLADYSGPAHVRTRDGSSYWANVNVGTSSGYNEPGRPEAITLDITRTDNAEPDGVTQAEWEAS